ncbi:MAG: hypothetical protein LUD27_04835 [Clostridia bacterium]|nr:hypothetical protein [Clostridia bacterium]
MLVINIPSIEKWDEKRSVFVHTKGCSIQLEHSLVSISKWESRWNQPFLTKKEKTPEQILDYIKCMSITQNISDTVYNDIPANELNKIIDYISAPMTATVFSDTKVAGRNETITSEVIYYWMVTLNIPFECQKWHLNRLLTLIRVCNIKNQPKKKIKTNELINRNAQLNAARRQRLNTRG